MTTSPKDELPGERFRRLKRLVAGTGPWSGTGISKDFFGEDWILPQVFWEALAADRIDVLDQPLKRLLTAPFGSLLDHLIADQGLQLAEGAIRAVLAACCYCQRRDDPTTAMEQLRQAARAFDRAWPAPPGKMATGSIIDDPCFVAYSAGVAATTVGFWTAWDLFDRLLGVTYDNIGRRLAITKLPGRLAAASPRTARLPLLLVDSDRSEGRLALLTVTLIPDGGGVFCPDPLVMGLSTLWGGGVQKSDGSGTSDIHASMQRIWELTRLGDRYRGRWSFSALTAETIQGAPKVENSDPLISECFSGRSAEAAVWCALQSAASDAENPLQLDHTATVTAMLDADATDGDVRQIPLKRIHGLIPKLDAAKGFLQMVVVADDQEQVEVDRQIAIARVKTVDEAFDRLLSLYRHVRNYQQQVDLDWKKEWAAPEEESDKPPFIETQRILWLTETANPRRYLHPSAFRSQRLGASGPGSAGDLDADKWIEISRGQFPGVKPIEDCDLRRTVVTTDAGIGKTSNLEWLHWKINAAGDGRLALLVPINELAASYDHFLPETLVKRFRRGVSGNSLERLEQNEAELILRRLRDAGKIVLLFDALDQTGAASAQIATLAEIVSHADWQGCPIVITGRPHALVLHWDSLLDHRSIGWRYLQLAEFDEAEQERYLGRTASGQSRYKTIRPEAREILGIPRVLKYLRGLDDADLSEIRTPSDVYYRSLRLLITEGMSKDLRARMIGPPANANEAQMKVETHRVDRAFKLLAAIAFEMTGQEASWTEGLQPEAEKVSRPNFDQITEGDFNEFRELICRRLPEPYTPADIDRLAALNGILQHGFFDGGDADGLRQILWRNRSLQEFCAAYWMSQYCTEQDAKTLSEWLYLPDDPLTEAYYWIWRYATEMPKKGRNSRRWPLAMSPLYEPGDGQTARRSNEMIYRSWDAMEQYATGHRILNAFMSEFEQIKDGKRGTSEQQRSATEFADSFVPIPKGTFLLGRPKDKPLPVDEAERQGVRQLVEAISAEELSGFLETSGFPVWRHGDKQWKLREAVWQERLESPQADAWKEAIVEWFLGAGFGDSEIPAQREQKVSAFEFCRDPVLNRWYRLFDPQHGLRPSWDREWYVKTSPEADTPVIYVSWWDSWVFCKWATWRGCSLRLPREREWEYAAKAGTIDLHYWWGDRFQLTKCNAANAMGQTTAPDDRHCNQFGLRDILGNVSEWCDDWYSTDYSGREHSYRVNRGGCFDDGPMCCRSARRDGSAPEDRNGGLGFRPARSSATSLPDRSV